MPPIDVVVLHKAQIHAVVGSSMMVTSPGLWGGTEYVYWLPTSCIGPGSEVAPPKPRWGPGKLVVKLKFFRTHPSPLVPTVLRLRKERMRELHRMKRAERCKAVGNPDCKTWLHPQHNKRCSHCNLRFDMPEKVAKRKSSH